ncbi:replication initiator protein A [Staphylococcus saprophyticus]|uniref:replication initiator protein A n=1 Tax=Staphylococcus saprophyticus TaxID=29385 RepID=UPI002DBB2B76|nr:replication initiator protein A [Staphylococcus saprophyticus]MEB7678025.1 replication initiator protein A [Staphylococcus saprophyticus]
MSNQYFTIQENYQEKFYRLPKVFFTNPKYIKLKNDSKIAYSILQDRLELSIKNKWVDQSGRIFFIYTDKKLAEILNISKNHVTTVKKELIEAELLIQKRQGLNKPNISYLLKPAISQDDIYIIESEETDLEVSSGKDSHTVGIQNHTQWESRITHSGNLESHTVGINDTEFSNTDFNETKLNDTTTTEKQNTSSSSNALKLIKKLENEFNIQVTKSYQKELETIFKPFTDDIIEYAIEYSSNNADYPKKYIKSILEVWKNEGIETLEEAKNFKIKSKTNRNKSMNNREKTPDWLKNKNNKQQIELSENENQHYNEIINKLLKLAHKKYDNDINAYEQLENEIDNMCNTEFNDLEVEEQKLIFDDTEKFINKKLANIEEVVNFKKELIIKWG